MNTPPSFSAFRCMDGAFKYLVANFGDFARLATPPVIGLAIVEALLQLVLPAPGVDDVGGPGGLPVENGGGAGFANLAFFGFSVVLYVMFAVAWHRKYLIPDEDMTVARALSWGPEKTRFLLYFILSFLLVMLVGVPIMTVVIFVTTALGGGLAAGAPMGLSGLTGMQIIPFIIGFLLVFAIFARLSLVFPAIAVGRRDFGFKAAWALTKGRAFGMLGVMILPGLLAMIASIPVMLVGMALDSAGALQTMTGTALLALVGQALSYLAIAFGVSALSVAYEALNGARPQ